MEIIRFILSLFRQPVQQPVQEVEYVPIATTTIPTPPPVVPPTPSELLYEKATQCLGRDVTPDDKIPDEVDCADTVNRIYEMTFGTKIADPGISTVQLYKVMLEHRKQFQPIIAPFKGCIIVSPTGYGNGILDHGHIGIFVNNDKIASNDSYTGKLTINYTLDSWKKRYKLKGGFPIVIFQPI